MGAEPKIKPASDRTTVSLDGTWEVGESKGGETPPFQFGHSAPVPGLLHSATPPFPNVGEFESREIQYMRMLMPLITGGDIKPEVNEDAKNAVYGVSHQGRDYFWYRRRFTAPQARGHALLTVLKAQFSSEVWVNGTKVGTRNSCFTSGTYDISPVIHWEAENEVIIRVGAHPGVLPPGNTTPYDFEKELWTPGIWDSVELHCFDGPAICSVQVAPRISPREILIETVIENLESSPAEIVLDHQVHDSDGKKVIGKYSETVKLEASETLTHRCTIPLPSAELWSPESPKLYWLESATPGDRVRTRFGVREFRFDTATKRAYLNDEIIFLRGNGVALGRFFEDPLCAQLPWTDDWVRKLLGGNPKKMNLNFLKFTIGPVPRRWLEIADEVGLMVLYEFPIWTFYPEVLLGYERNFDRPALKQEMGDWVRDCRNHPSIIYWDGSLESRQSWLNAVINEVRTTDLSDRAWSNSFNMPPGPNDPLEDHPYEFSGNAILGGPKFDMIKLEMRGGFERPSWGGIPTGHASVIAEYGWLWVTREGDPTMLTRSIYPTLPFPAATRRERIRTASYLVAGLTEYWRSYRHYAGVAYYGYLAASRPESFTSDYFEDVETLQFHPEYQDYVGEAFKPLGVYLNFWQRELEAGTNQELVVMLCNDFARKMTGKMRLALESEGKETLLFECDFLMIPWGQETFRCEVKLPQEHGTYTLKATATSSDGSSTVSRRWVKIGEKPAPVVLEDGSFGQKMPDQ